MIVYTGGTFDLFHAGHVNLLKACDKLSGEHGEVVVSLNTDAFINRYKGKPPVMSYKEREAVLKACRYVDVVIPNEDGEDSKPAILAERPQILVIGSDWAKKDYYKQMNFTQEWLDNQNILLCYVPYTENISTTNIKKRICE